ncbi:MAG: EAL domain-containing protein [Proteobacteria bacterium]|nr:EAL domain-containing protein [Pseudomonadota bacterium]MDA0928115.1 EAL domain-containing protein [Pseudomonadota bacterium]
MTITAAGPQNSRRSLLLIDDDALMPALLSKTTTDSGYSMESTTNPSRLDSMDLDKFDVVILDLMMPKIDGIDVIAQLAASKFKGGLILISGLGEDCLQSAAKMANSFRLDCLGALPKPVRSAELKPLLTKHLYKLFSSSWTYQQPVTADPKELAEAIKGNLIQTEAKPIVSSCDSVARGGEIIASWEKEGQCLDHNALCRSAALDGTTSTAFTFFLLRQAFRTLNRSTPSRMEVSIRLPGTGFLAAMKDKMFIEAIRSANLVLGSLVVSFDASEVVELGDSLRSQCLELARHGIKFAVDVQSTRLLRNPDYISAPFRRVVVTKPHILHPGYESALTRLMDYAERKDIETVVSDIDSLNSLQKARTAGFTYVRPQLMKSKPNSGSRATPQGH